MKIYAELIGDDEKQVIKSTCDNKLKSQLESGEALYGISVEASETGEVYEIYTAGTKRDQSKIVFNEADLMTRGSILRSKFNFKRDEILHLKTGSWIKALSKEDGKSGDGTNPAYLILDEYHQHKTTEFYDLGLGSNRKEPLLSIITTAGRDLTYPCYTQEYDYCSKLLDPNVDVSNDEYFVDICEADEGDDPGDVTTWKKANPIRAFFDEGVKDIAAEWKIAKEIPEKMIAFRTKILDQWVMAANNGYMDMGKWKACEVRELPIDLTGRPVFVGFDMSSKDLERSAATLRKINSVNSVKAKQKDNKRPKDEDIRIYLQNHQYYQRKSIYWTDNTRVQKEVSM